MTHPRDVPPIILWTSLPSDRQPTYEAYHYGGASAPKTRITAHANTPDWHVEYRDSKGAWVPTGDVWPHVDDSQIREWAEGEVIDPNVSPCWLVTGAVYAPIRSVVRRGKPKPIVIVKDADFFPRVSDGKVVGSYMNGNHLDIYAENVEVSFARNGIVNAKFAKDCVVSMVGDAYGGTENVVDCEFRDVRPMAKGQHADVYQIQPRGREKVAIRGLKGNCRSQGLFINGPINRLLLKDIEIAAEKSVSRSRIAQPVWHAVIEDVWMSQRFSIDAAAWAKFQHHNIRRVECIADWARTKGVPIVG